jgi:hypothetical protein
MYSPNANAFTSSTTGGQPFVIPRGRREGLDLHGPRDVVVGRGLQRLIREQRGDQDDAVQLDPVARLQLARKTRRPDRAVALADQVLGRGIAVVGLEVLVDELAKRPDVALLAVELLVVHARHDTAVAGVDRVDEHEVADVEQRVLVVDELVGRRRQEALVGHSGLARRE